MEEKRGDSARDLEALIAKPEARGHTMKDIALSRLENPSFLDDCTDWMALADNVDAALLRARGMALTAFCAVPQLGAELRESDLRDVLWALSKELDAAWAIVQMFVEAKEDRQCLET